MNLAKVESPSFMLNFPSSFDTKVKNNVWMKEGDEPVDKELALAQWTELYNFLSSNGFCTIMPTPNNCDLQDLVFVANLGIMINEDTVVVSNFTSEPRMGETKVGEEYFKIAGIKNVVTCPYKFEGEADLKHIDGNLFIGGYGIRTDIKAYEWMEEQFGIKIIKVKMDDEKLYHFDCILFPITKNIVLACKEKMSKNEINQIQDAGIEIINIPLKYAECGLTNSVRLHNFVLNSSDIYDLDPVLDKEDYRLERDKNQFLEDILVELGMEPVFINLSEFTLGGAMLSCLVFHFNRFSYNIDLV